MMRLRSIPINYVIIPCISIFIQLWGEWYATQDASWLMTLKIPFFLLSKRTMDLSWYIVSILTTAIVLGIWNREERTVRFWKIITLFSLNAILTMSWHYLVFQQHALGLAALNIGMTAAITTIILILLWPLSRMASFLLLPHVLWATYTTVVMATLWMLNK